MSRKLAIDGGEPVRKDFLRMAKANYGYEELSQILEVFNSEVFCSVDSRATKVKEFEKLFAEYIGCKYALSFSSGTTAQHASLIAAGVGEGDEVIVPPLTFVSTAYTVILAGAKPVFVDVDDNSITLDPDKIEEAITDRTKAIVPVHWFGFPAEMDKIMDIARKNKLMVIEDCAHGFGSIYKGRNVGTIGDMSCWSLQETKTITSGGDGGMLITNDENIALIAESVRDHGKDKGTTLNSNLPYNIIRQGNNYRLSELHAAFGIAQLKKIDGFLAERKIFRDYLDSEIVKIPNVTIPDINEYIVHGNANYPIRFKEEAMKANIVDIGLALNAEGINSIDRLDEYPPDHTLFREHCGPTNTPVAVKIKKELLLLPLHPGLTINDLKDIVKAVDKVAENYSS